MAAIRGFSSEKLKSTTTPNKNKLIQQYKEFVNSNPMEIPRFQQLMTRFKNYTDDERAKIWKNVTGLNDYKSRDKITGLLSEKEQILEKFRAAQGDNNNSNDNSNSNGNWEE
jgi:hypothetical protein